MRLLRWIGVLLIFSGSFSALLAGGGSRRLSPRDIAGLTAAVSLEKQIRTALGDVKQRLTGGAKKLRPSECGTRTCYSARDVTKLVDATRADLTKGIPKEAEALRVAVENEIDAEMARLQPQAAGAIQLVRLQPGPAAGYDAASVSSVIDHIVAAIDHILGFNKLALPLSVSTTPTHAHFEMQIKANQHAQHRLDTDGHLPNVWRGIYTGTVTKSGYKDGVAYIDLINGAPTHVTCTLQPAGNADVSYCQVE